MTSFRVPRALERERHFRKSLGSSSRLMTPARLFAQSRLPTPIISSISLSHIPFPLLFHSANMSSEGFTTATQPHLTTEATSTQQRAAAAKAQASNAAAGVLNHPIVASARDSMNGQLSYLGESPILAMSSVRSAV